MGHVDIETSAHLVILAREAEVSRAGIRNDQRKTELGGVLLLAIEGLCFGD